MHIIYSRTLLKPRASEYILFMNLIDTKHLKNIKGILSFSFLNSVT